jgi:peptide chain release factor 2
MRSASGFETPRSVSAGCGAIFDPARLTDRLAALEERMQASDFWDDAAAAQQVSADYSLSKRRLDDFAALEARGEEARFFSGKFDEGGAIVTIHPGAGGTESQDWAEMLLRMYLRWFEHRGFKVEINEAQEGDEAGLKSATLTVEGDNVYGLLNAEKGVHRLVRLSPFDSANRRHTSFASVETSPLVSDEVEVEIDEDDLRVDTYRSSGAGGQHVNKTSSAVRITHLPTGIVVQCQNERSQLSNRATAMRMLKSRLVELEERKRAQELASERGEQMDVNFGSQIRNYVLHPYQMVKDLRSGFEVGNAQGVLDGDLDGFVHAYLVWRAGDGAK